MVVNRLIVNIPNLYWHIVTSNSYSDGNSPSVSRVTDELIMLHLYMRYDPNNVVDFYDGLTRDITTGARDIGFLYEGDSGETYLVDYLIFIDELYYELSDFLETHLRCIDHINPDRLKGCMIYSEMKNNGASTRVSVNY